MIDPISWAHSWPYILAGFAAAYLLGSIPFGQVLTKLAGLGDVRKIGSGNIGATNVLRTGNKKLAATTLVLDGAKGAVAVLFADIYGPDIAIVAAAGALLGHLFPVWLKFLGGKGVATALGILLALFCRSVGSHAPLGCWQPFCFGIRPCPLCWPWRRPRYTCGCSPIRSARSSPPRWRYWSGYVTIRTSDA